MCNTCYKFFSAFYLNSTSLSFTLFCLAEERDWGSISSWLSQIVKGPCISMGCYITRCSAGRWHLKMGAQGLQILFPFSKIACNVSESQRLLRIIQALLLMRVTQLLASVSTVLMNMLCNFLQAQLCVLISLGKPGIQIGSFLWLGAASNYCNHYCDCLGWSQNWVTGISKGLKDQWWRGL